MLQLKLKCLMDSYVIIKLYWICILNYSIRILIQRIINFLQWLES